MAPVPHAEWQNVLRAAIEDRYGSLNGYAKHRAGPNATAKQVEAKRRPMMKWLQENEPKKPTPASIAKLHADGIDFDPDALPNRSKPHRHTTEELVALMERALANQQRLVPTVERIADVMESVLAVAQKNARSHESARRQLTEVRRQLEELQSRPPLAGHGG